MSNRPDGFWCPSCKETTTDGTYTRGCFGDIPCYACIPSYKPLVKPVVTTWGKSGALKFICTAKNNSYTWYSKGGVMALALQVKDDDQVFVVVGVGGVDVVTAINTVEES